jgi:uncharacterized protein YndB with AHSA1/START domain
VKTKNYTMSILVTILLALAGILALLLIIAIFIKREHYVKRDIIINAPLQKVFDYVKLVMNQEKFSKWAAADDDRKKEFRGTDGTVGFVYSWSGNKKAGEGQKEIMNIVEGKRIETEMRFVKPMAAVAQVVMETESLSDEKTRVSWSNLSELKYPLNIMVPMVERMLAKEMDISLSNLKNILEK